MFGNSTPTPRQPNLALRYVAVAFADVHLVYSVCVAVAFANVHLVYPVCVFVHDAVAFADVHLVYSVCVFVPVHVAVALVALVVLVVLVDDVSSPTLLYVWCVGQFAHQQSYAHIQNNFRGTE